MASCRFKMAASLENEKNAEAIIGGVTAEMRHNSGAVSDFRKTLNEINNENNNLKP